MIIRLQILLSKKASISCEVCLFRSQGILPQVNSIILAIFKVTRLPLRESLPIGTWSSNSQDWQILQVHVSLLEIMQLTGSLLLSGGVAFQSSLTYLPPPPSTLVVTVNDKHCGSSKAPSHVYAMNTTQARSSGIIQLQSCGLVSLVRKSTYLTWVTDLAWA